MTRLDVTSRYVDLREVAALIDLEADDLAQEALALGALRIGPRVFVDAQIAADLLAPRPHPLTATRKDRP